MPPGRATAPTSLAGAAGCAALRTVFIMAIDSLAASIGACRIGERDRHARDDRRPLETRPLLLAEIGFVVTQGFRARGPPARPFGPTQLLRGRTDCIA